jgi:phage-related protein
MGSMKDKTVSGLADIASTVGSALSGLKEKISSGLGSIVTGFSTAFANVASGLKEKLSDIGSVFSDLAQKALGWGKDIIANLVSGITSKISDVINSVKNVASSIASYLHFSEPDEGPLSNFHTFMPDMIDLLSQGITGNIGKLDRPMNELSSAMIPKIGGASTSYGDDGNNGRVNDNSAGINALTDTVIKYLPKLAEQQIVLDSGTLVGELSGGLNRQLGKAYL